jgi:hypothetical protein
MPVVYFEGDGGLGNCLYQLAVAVWYKETYSYFNYKILCKYTNATQFGTSVLFDRKKAVLDDKGNPIPYNKTIFKNIEFTEKKYKGKILFNDYTDTKITSIGQDLIIKGYNQHRNLFKNSLKGVKQILNLSFPYEFNILNSIELEVCVCICIRLGKDWINKYNTESYCRAFDTLKNIASFKNAIVLSDVDDIKEHGINLPFPYIPLNVPDIVQFQIGIKCGHYILSDSTFHAWIAYLGCVDCPEKKVIFFQGGDFTKRNLSLDHWIGV